MQIQTQRLLLEEHSFKHLSHVNSTFFLNYFIFQSFRFVEL
jgi:hypothetical protein